MKAAPVRLVHGVGYEPCDVSDCTHVMLDIPGGTGLLALPVILRGTREGTGCWTWNGNTESPTLRPSVLTTRRAWDEVAQDWGEGFRCHSWINGGNAQFLDDCSHDLRGQTVPLNEVQPPEAP